MKKIFLIIVLLFVLVLPVNAAETDDKYNDKLNNYFEKYGLNLDEISDNPVEIVWQAAKQAIKNNMYEPVAYFARIAAVLFFSSLINFFISSETESIIKLVNIISMIVIIANVYDDFKEIIDSVSMSFFEIKNFMISFLPVFAGVSFASGEMITSTVYTGLFLVCVVTVANVCLNYIIPSLNIYMAIGMTTTVSDVVNLKPLCDFYTKAIKIVMTASVSVICFLLNTQTTITQAQDSLAVKTGKILVTSAVPIIGSTLQGAVSSVYASMGILKGFCGIAGIVVIINIMLPHIIRLTINWIGYFMLVVISNILENKIATNLLYVFQQIIEIMLSITALFFILLIFSLSIMIKTFQGV